MNDMTVIDKTKHNQNPAAAAPRIPNLPLIHSSIDSMIGAKEKPQQFLALNISIKKYQKSNSQHHY